MDVTVDLQMSRCLTFKHNIIEYRIMYIAYKIQNHLKAKFSQDQKRILLLYIDQTKLEYSIRNMTLSNVSGIIFILFTWKHL